MERIHIHLYSISHYTILTIFAILIFPPLTFANGAAEWRGIQGNDIAIIEKMPFKNFVVDEEVTINGWMNEVAVKYNIDNKSSKLEEFTMLFPIEGNLACETGEDQDNISKRLNFEVGVNGEKLIFEEIGVEDVLLEGDYKKFQTTACFLVRFPVRILPGTNVISIKYNLLPQGIGIDGGVGTWTYNYSIWPAKNWVSKFRHASWRVILPRTIQGTILPTHKYGEYFTDDERRLENTYAINVNISAPGTRNDYSDQIVFEAHNFAPSGQITVNVSPRPLKYDVKECSSDELDCVLPSLKSLLIIRPYVGNRRCYDLRDLNVIVEEGDFGGFRYSAVAIPFLRNEIFARRGYVFKSDMVKWFFSDMPWYKLSVQDIKLNEFETWNVNFLKKIENAILSDDQKNLADIYAQVKKTCPK